MKVTGCRLQIRGSGERSGIWVRFHRLLALGAAMTLLLTSCAPVLWGAPRRGLVRGEPQPTQWAREPSPSLTAPPDVAPTFTHTPVPPSATPTSTYTPSLPTPTNTRVVPLSPGWPTNTPKPPTPAITAWRGAYYANRTLAGAPALVRSDPSVSFNWDEGAPAPGLPSDNFSVRWARALNFENRIYRFYILVDDGVRLWIDDELVIDAWYDSSLHTVTGVHTMTQGRHQIRVEYYDRTGQALIQMRWETTSSSYPDWKGEYWSNRDLEDDPTLVRNDRDPDGDKGLDFEWGSGAPAPELPKDDFSARWTRTIYFSAGTYRFHAVVDDGVRLWVDDQSILDAWYDSRSRELTADYPLGKGFHSLKVEYYEHSGGARIRVWWDRIGTPSYLDWKGEYWSNLSLSGKPALVRNDKGPDETLGLEFDWGSGAPAYGLPVDGFSVRWSRQVDFESGRYRFKARTDDGIRFYLDGNLIIDEWHDSSADELYEADLALYGEHGLVVEYYHRDGDARVEFSWTRTQRGPQRD